MYYIKNTPVSLKGAFEYSLRFLKCESYSDVYKQTVGCLKEPLDYVGLMAYVFPLFSSEINSFVGNRIKFVRNYLLGNYDLCLQIIENVNTSAGYSAWAAINTIKLAGLQGGLDKSLKAFNHIYEQGVSPLMEKTCSAAQETASIETSLDTFLDKRYIEDIKKFTKEKWQEDYITAHYYPFKKVEIGKWLSYDLMSSIVDLYVNFIYNIGSIIEKYHNEERLVKYLRIIANSIDDDLLLKKMSFLNLCEYENTNERYSLLKQLSMDMPLDDLMGVDSYFKEYPYDIDLLFEYVSYLVRNHRNDLDVFMGNSLFSKIGLSLYEYLDGKNKVTSLNKLKMICLSNSTFLCFRQLYTLLVNLEKGDLTVLPNRYWLNSYGINYFDAEFFEEKVNRKNFLVKHKLNVEPDDKTSNQYLDENYLRQIILLDNLQDTTIVSCLLEYLQKNVPSYLRGAVLSSEFSALFDLKKYKEAILLYVDNKLKYSNLNVYINVENIEKILTKTVAASLNIPLELAIFYSLINAKQTKLLSNVLRYLNQIGVKKPSEIPVEVGNLKNKYFLENVVDINILTTIPLIFPEPSQPIEERIRILDNLRKSYDDEDKIYSNERNSLVRKLGIMNMLKSVDASKIDVDENMLKRHELAFGKDFFELYTHIPVDLKVYKEALAYKALFPDEPENKTANSDKGQGKTVSYRYLIFVKFFQYIRDEFLLNDNAGLDYYLSSRVRHGTIANQLRFNFQNLKLTTRKGISGNYDMNLYWTDEILHLTGEERVKCMDAFFLFTQNVDDIINELKKNKIQVKTEKHNSGLPACFDFSYEKINLEIQRTYVEVDGLSYELIIDAIFKKLWLITEDCFQIVVSAVSDTESKLKKELDDLYEKVKTYVPVNSDGMNMFETAYNRCLTHLHEDITLVSKWFKRKQQQEEDFQMQQLLDASVEAINKVRSSKLTLELQNFSKSSFKGCFLIILFDLFHNIFNNVVDYFDKQNDEPKCKVIISEEVDLLKIKVSNKILNKDIRDAEEKIDNYKKYHDGLDKQSRSRLEGKSGLYKINTIVYHQLMGKDNKFIPLISDNQYIVSISINKQNMVSNA